MRRDLLAQYAAVIALCTLSSATTTAQETVPELVRRHKGNVEFLVIREFSPVGLSELARDCDLIARVVVVDGRSHLSDDEREVQSEYTLQIIDSLLSRKTLTPAQNIIVTKPGGTLTIDGYQFTTRETDFPPFLTTDEYVLFLRFDARTGKYVVPYGAQGAFRHVAGVIEQVGSGEWNTERRRVSLLDFIQELTAILTPR